MKKLLLCKVSACLILKATFGARIDLALNVVVNTAKFLDIANEVQNYKSLTGETNTVSWFITSKTFNAGATAWYQ